ncbi:MAG: hypothetical protein IJQ07_00055 [Clostridia bacterium]|nr:hypothetical protein [Clostridia bacterium]
MGLKFKNKKNANNELTLIVCSCDNYEDVWYPYFELFKRNWKGFRYDIILNTETKSYSHQDLNIKCLQLYKNKDLKTISWSDRMIETLNYVSSDYVMLTCEDNFIVSPVDNEKFEKAFDIIKNDRRISMLSFAGKLRDYEKTKWIGDFGRISMKKRYRVVLDTAIWRKDALLRNLKPGESPWEFEIKGTERALWDFTEYYRYKNYDEFNDAEPIINVPFTSFQGIGITGGKWRWRNPELFAEYDIKMDFSIRGLLDKETCLKESKEAIEFSESYRKNVEENKIVQFKQQFVRRSPQWLINLFVKIKRVFKKIVK